MLYFDNSATTKTDNRVIDTMMPYITNNFGNASSIYSIGRQSRSAIENARSQVSKFLNCNASEIYFTSGGTESDNLAIMGIANAYKKNGNHIITSTIEHPAVLNTLERLKRQGFDITYVDVDKNGIIDVDKLENSITDRTILITTMFANNEIGTIQPIEKIGKIAKAHKIVFHTDAVQAIGHIDIDINKLNIDSLSLSGHKIYGPKGIGALYIRKGVKCDPLILGGHQERDHRAGTENVAGIVGLGKAIELLNDLDNELISQLRDHTLYRITNEISGVTVNGSMEHRLPNNINVSIDGISGDALLFNLDLKGICASSGSACSSGSLEPSHVLTAIGVPEKLAKSSLRITLGKYNTLEECDFLVDVLKEIVLRLRNIK